MTAFLLHPFLLYIGYPWLIFTALMSCNQDRWPANIVNYN